MRSLGIYLSLSTGRNGVSRHAAMSCGELRGYLAGKPCGASSLRPADSNLTPCHMFFFKTRVSAGISLPAIAIGCTCHALSQPLNKAMKSAENVDARRFTFNTIVQQFAIHFLICMNAIIEYKINDDNGDYIAIYVLTTMRYEDGAIMYFDVDTPARPTFAELALQTLFGSKYVPPLA